MFNNDNFEFKLLDILKSVINMDFLIDEENELPDFKGIITEEDSNFMQLWS